MDLASTLPSTCARRARLELYSTTSPDALVRTTGAAWENEGGKVEVGARSLAGSSSRRGGREARGDREKEGKKDKTVEREGGSLLG